MKTLNLLKTVFFIIIISFLSSCNNDDDGVLTTCTTQGLFYDLGVNPQVFIPEANLTTDFFVTSSNGPEVEIYGSGIVFVTTTVNLNQTGNGTLIIGNGPNETVNVSCVATGSMVGDTMRFVFNGVYNGDPITGEFCVTIDVVH
ncbi:hypothetical protein [Olleya aquimaris]|uniref:DUF3992 domain-containing protein n=1 Tax=Olleya aquimaris TaxID=639310 RepID=A0A327R868_9FLAO|nr:hypothetical protein [Olleya aquimaris]RAJ11874.1 hypothetical protein LY08_02583 [Olleya aquimaris]